MNYFKLYKISAAFLFFGGCSFASAQSNKPTPAEEQKLRLKTHISYLASDELKGRQTGSPGEVMSAEYISKEFKKNGLKLLGNNGYQQFTITQFRIAGDDCKLVLISPDGAAPPREFELFTDYYPLSPTVNYDSCQGEAIDMGYGIVAEKLGKNDYENVDVKGKIVVIRNGYFAQDENPHSELANYADVSTKVKEAEARGAAGVIFLRNSANDEHMSGKLARTTIPSNFPVFYFKSNFGFPKGLHVKMVSKVVSPTALGHNVIGYKNNFRRKTVIVCAHHDHIGYNEYENSRYNGPQAIHNGADDNASGVAAMIELSKQLKKWGYRKHNYLFIAFSGEVLGLLGSKFFTQNPLIDMKKVNYVINIDMLGRIDSTKKTLTINGVGTSPVWKQTLSKIKTDTTLLYIATTESGMGPSDHASFYLENKPVLHFFSGQHRDYHTPDDDENRINYDGMVFSIDVIKKIVKQNKRKKLPFTKTVDPSPGKTRFKVTLGVMPDYSYSNKGLRIDGVTPDKAAAKAGLQRNDIVLKLGDFSVNDIQDYMSALGKFNPGDKTKATIQRGSETLEVDIQF